MLEDVDRMEIVDVLEEKGAVTQDKLSELADMDYEDVPEQIGDARDSGHDIVRMKEGGSYIVKYRQNGSESGAEGLQGDALWQKVLNGAVQGDELSPELLEVNGDEEKNRDAARRVKEILKDNQGSMRYRSLAGEMDGMTSELRRGLSHLGYEGEVEYGPEEVELTDYERSTWSSWS